LLIKPDRDHWAIETFGLRKQFLSRRGLPPGYGVGSAQWIISNLVKYRQKAQFCLPVDGVDLKVKRGELLSLLGPNGAGKTTLIKCLSTLLQIDEGEAFVNGYNVRSHPDQVRLSINLVGSGHWVGFDWNMTATQNLHFFGALYGLGHKERQERIDYTLDLMRLTTLANSTPRTMSTGERQRLLLAKGFMIKAPIIFLDEPTVGLDPTGAREVRDFIHQEMICNMGVSGILTTHRMAEAERLSQRVAIMNRGRIVACATPTELKQMAGRRSILEVRASAINERVVGTVKNLRGVLAAAASPAGEEVTEDLLRVHCNDADALMGPIMDVLRNENAGVLSVEPQEPTLEDAFMALTEEEAV
jgi:ABC-2 type transport system ATP-binding protein